MLSLEEILSELEKKTKFSRKQLYEKVKKKHEELSGLISMEGAGHLVARDLGVNLIGPEKRVLRIKDITHGMRNVNLKARIIQVSEIREFERKDGDKGRVCNLVLTDGTGEIRIPLWDKQVSMVEDGEISEGNVIQVKNAFAKESDFGMELRLSRVSKIKKIDDDKSIPYQATERGFKRTNIKDTKLGNCEVRANVVQVFNVNPLFKTCPECRSRVEETEKGYECPEHGKVKPENNMIISGIIDDGTASMRSVFFRDQAKTLSGLNPSVLMKMSQDEALDLIRENTLGNTVIIKGRIQKNKIFDTLEMIANNVEELDIQKESKRLINKIKSYKRVD